MYIDFVMIDLHQFILTIVFLAFVTPAFNQITSGVAQYEVVSKAKDIEEDTPAILEKFMERFREDNGELFFITLEFNRERSFSTYGKKVSKDEMVASPNFVSIDVHNKPDICYNVQNNIITRNKTFKDTSYCVSEEYKLEDWEFTQNKKTINGYDCKEAIKKQPFKDKVLKRVWYCEDISLPFGPSDYIGFPGLVISASNDEIEMSLITLKPKKVEPVCDVEGIPITGVEYDAKKQFSYQKWLDSFKKK